MRIFPKNLLDEIHDENLQVADLEIFFILLLRAEKEVWRNFIQYPLDKTLFRA